MRCLSPSEAEALFGHLGFSISLKHAWYRSALMLDNAHSHGQMRIAANQPDDIGYLPDFIRALNRWLPPEQDRLFWADHWETGEFGGHENAVAAAAWRGLGESRSLAEAPGLLLDAQNWDEQDQSEVAPTHAEAMGLLVGLITLLMMTHSDGWLISAGSVDRVEFWEGNFFFHSADATQLKRANSIVDEYGCTRWETSD